MFNSIPSCIVVLRSLLWLYYRGMKYCGCEKTSLLLKLVASSAWLVCPDAKLCYFKQFFGGFIKENSDLSACKHTRSASNPSAGKNPKRSELMKHNQPISHWIITQIPHLSNAGSLLRCFLQGVGAWKPSIISRFLLGHSRFRLLLRAFFFEFVMGSSYIQRRG
jgi:hypothetical protein